VLSGVKYLAGHLDILKQARVLFTNAQYMKGSSAAVLGSRSSLWWMRVNVVRVHTMWGRCDIVD
jgi:hypothetical protein